MAESVPTRITPLGEADWAAQLEGVRDGLGTVLNVHRVMAHNPGLLAAWAPLRRHVVSDGALSPRHRELIILRLAHRAGVAYEWHHHLLRAQQAGIGNAEAEAIRIGASAGWDDERDILVLTATDELFDDLAVSDTSWAELARFFTIPEILDVVVTVGVYTTLAMLINVAGVQIEDEA